MRILLVDLGHMHRLILIICLVLLSGCSTPSKPVIHYASENSIAIKYQAYGAIPAVTAQAIDMAIEHCNKHGKGMKLVGSHDSVYTHTEIHTFMCTNDLTDERIEVKLKGVRIKRNAIIHADLKSITVLAYFETAGGGS